MRCSGWACRMRGIWLATGLSMLAGCATGSVRIETVSYQGWADSYRMSNGQVEVIVVPALGRIMRYGFVGEQNVLWENTKVASEGGYHHWGGDKVWPWPQTRWVTDGWPPPPGWDPMRCEAHVEGKTLVTRSELLPEYGLRVVRRLSLADAGTELRIVSRFEKVGEGREDAVGVWSVTQVPSPDLILALLPPDTPSGQEYVAMGRVPGSIRRQGRVLLLQRDPRNATKIGCEAEVLAAQLGEILFVQKWDGTGTSAGTYAPGEKAQVYGDADRQHFAAAGLRQYVELELTSPTKALRGGESVTLAARWQLMRLSKEQQRTDRLIEIIGKL